MPYQSDNPYNEENECSSCGDPLNECLMHSEENCPECPQPIGDFHWECWIGEICPVCHSTSDYCQSMWHHVCPECRRLEEECGEVREIFLEPHPECDALVYYCCVEHNYYPTPYPSMERNPHENLDNNAMERICHTPQR